MLEMLLTIVVVACLAGFVGYSMGHASGRDEVETEIENEAAAHCLSCGRADEAAERLDAINAVVTGVEYYGDPIGLDPVQDVNWILRIAKTHAKRSQSHRIKVMASAAMHPDAKHRDAHGEKITS